MSSRPIKPDDPPGGRNVERLSLPAGRDVVSVELRHTLADGSSHIDWMIDAAGPDVALDPEARTLITFRLAAPLAAGLEAEVVRLEDHRRRYLHYEGETGGGRGRVERIGRWRVRIQAATADGCGPFTLLLRDAAGCRPLLRATLSHADGAIWRFSAGENPTNPAQ